MTCISTGTLTICRPDNRFLRRRIEWCPMEMKNQEMVVRYEEWYPAITFCCGCGDAWNRETGEPRVRPLMRWWRRDAVRKHRAMWDRATYGPPPSLADFRADAS